MIINSNSAMNFIRKHKHFFAFFSALLLEFWFSMCAYAVNHDKYSLAISANLTYPFVTMLPMILIIEQEDLWGKLKIAFYEGVGFAVGTVIFLAFLKPHLV